MFKKEKDLVERSRSLLKNREVKGLKTEILKQFPGLTEQSLNELIPNKADVTIIKLANRTLLYSMQNLVYFFDLEGRNKLFPTLFTLQRFPDMMRAIVTHGPVSRYILRGADFMIPGIATYHGLEGIKKGEKCCLRIVGNPYPFAIGESLIGYEHLSTAVRGKACLVHHVYGDLLVNPGSLAATATANADMSATAATVAFSAASFTIDEIYPIPGYTNDDSLVQSQAEKNQQVLPQGKIAGVAWDEDEDEEDEGQAADAALAGVDMLANLRIQEVEDQVKDEQQSAAAVAVADPAADDQDKDDHAVQDQDQSQSKDEDQAATSITKRQLLDAQLLHALILYLRNFLKDTRLPISIATVYPIIQRIYQIYYTPSGSSSETEVYLDIKQTSYKRVQTFLVDYVSRQLQLIDCGHQVATGEGEVASSEVVMIVQVKRQHPLYTQHKYTAACNPATAGLAKLTELDKEEEVMIGKTTLTLDAFKQQVLASLSSPGSVSTGVAGGSSSGSQAAAAVKKITAIELYKPTKRIRDLLTIETAIQGGEYSDQHYTKREVKEWVSSYAIAALFDQLPPLVAGSSSNSSGSMYYYLPRESMIVQEWFWPQKSTQPVVGQIYHPSAGTGSGAVAATSAIAGKKVVSSAAAATTRTVAFKQQQQDDEERVEEEEEEEEEAANEGYSSSYAASDAQPLSLAAYDQLGQVANKQQPSSSSLIQITDDMTKEEILANLQQSKKLNQTKGDEVKFWKPVELPKKQPPPSIKAAAAATAGKGAAGKGVAGNSSQQLQGKQQPPQKQAIPDDSNIAVGPAGSIYLMVTKEDYYKTILSKFTLYHTILTPTATSNASSSCQPKISSGPIPAVSISAESRMGGKMVTLIRGLTAYLSDAEGMTAFIKKAQKKFACAVSQAAVPGLPHDMEIIIQGNYVLEVEQFLIDIYSLPKQFIQVKIAVGKGKKK